LRSPGTVAGLSRFQRATAPGNSLVFFKPSPIDCTPVLPQRNTEMKYAALILALSVCCTPALAGNSIPSDDPWARAIGETRTIEQDYIVCKSQDDVEQVRAIQRTPGLSMDIPRCTLFKRGDWVVVVSIEYGVHACGNPGNSCATVYVQAHKVGDQRRYWVDGPIELYEVRSK
jgi:hypothetical protein